jgi:hypothetical protein
MLKLFKRESVVGAARAPCALLAVGGNRSGVREAIFQETGQQQHVFLPMLSAGKMSGLSRLSDVSYSRQVARRDPHTRGVVASAWSNWFGRALQFPSLHQMHAFP